ncbi:MAG: hypothetical protein EB830_06220 [Nitrosopumilus sp. H13]|nr:MAG: hypothetical protein EB830_06220 [Nitrosopumilus sp. H13]
MKAEFVLLMVSAALVAMLVPGAAADQPKDAVIVTPINEEISLKQTSITMIIPEENKLVWGYVRGGPSEYVERYPVIIQFLQDEEPVHVAQIDVKGDGSYDYKFRVKSTDLATGETYDIFHGKYTVKVFRVVPNADSIA